MLSVEGLTKRFGETVALDRVDLALNPGEVLALVGENGAGKSTLVKLLGGIYLPDAGRIRLDGRPLSLNSPRQARAAGITVIHQDRQVVPRLSVAENLLLGLPQPRRAGLFVDWAALRRRAERVLADLGIALPPTALARDLSPADQALLEIARAWQARARILILDEPTASLGDREVRILFALIRRLQGTQGVPGTAFLYVSHRLEEVLEIAGTIAVLRNGRLVERLHAAEASRARLIQAITGSGGGTDARRVPAHRYAPAGTGVLAGTKVLAADTPRQPLLEVRDLATRDGTVRSASLALYPGEVLGLFGLAGAGRTELLEALFGLRPLAHGTITIDGRDIGTPVPHRQLRAGVALLGEDRRRHGLIPRYSLRANITLQTLKAHSRLGLMRPAVEARTVREQGAALEIRGSSAQRVETLSGGNQQKVLFARLLLADPRILLCDEPTHAVDIGTRRRIHALLLERASRGCGVLFVSSDLPELLSVSDRLLVMTAGRTVGVLANDELDAETVMQLSYEQHPCLGPRTVAG